MVLVFDRDAVDEPLKYPARVAPEGMLARLLRLIFFARQLTLDDFAGLYQAHGKAVNWPSDDIRARHNNDRRAIASPTKLTLYLFIRIVCNILRQDIVRFEIVVRDPRTGQRTTYRSDDPLE